MLIAVDRWAVHAPSMAHQASARQAAQQVDNALAYHVASVAPVSAHTARVCGARPSTASNVQRLRGAPLAMAAPSRPRRPRMRLSANQLPLPLELPAPPQLIPLPEAQQWLGVSPETFTRLLLSGQLPVVHLGRKVRIEDTVLLAWLTAHGRFPARGEA
jgi:excisionase family DNA binding protein